ncbi:MAG: thermonuclease family protein [Rhizobiaceae bacterium]|nr:thermonuclease family protein [Rhizobiaceae bacterium]
MNRLRFSRPRPPARRGPLRLIGDMMLAIGLLALALVALARFAAPGLQAAPGEARAIDGDSLNLNGEEVRLWGIDAPEFQQGCIADGSTVPCGRMARERLAQLLKDQAVACAATGRDRYDRVLAICRTDAGEINATLVREGHAFDFGGYAAEEAEARSARRGVWAGDNERPRAYRERTKAAIEDGAGLLERGFAQVLRLWL